MDHSRVLPNSQEHWEASFSSCGQWEANGGRTQTRLFAESFHRTIRVPFRGSFTVLDLGCALGDALPVWHRHYPQAQLSGCDYVPAAVARCRHTYGHLAMVFRSGWADLQGTWDVIYCSNVLEHFENCREIASRLLSHCRILYVMTPYKELDSGRSITSINASGHVVTMDRSTFNSVGKVKSRVIRAPIAWGPTLWQEIRNRIGMYRRLQVYHPMRQIIYTIAM